MKYLKAFLVAVIMIFTFGSAMAQIQVRARVGGDRYHRHHWHHRMHRHDRRDRHDRRY